MSDPLAAASLTHLEELARSATPDHWEFIDYTHGDPDRDGWFGVLRGAFEVLDERFQVGRVKYSALPPEENKANAQYIAACSPAVVLSLIAALRTARRTTARTHKEHCPAHPHIAMCICDVGDDADCEVMPHHNRGGQQAGVYSGATMRHRPTGLTFTAENERSMLRNKLAAFAGLRALVEAAASPPSVEPPANVVDPHWNVDDELRKVVAEPAATEPEPMQAPREIILAKREGYAACLIERTSTGEKRAREWARDAFPLPMRTVPRDLPDPHDRLTLWRFEHGVFKWHKSEGGFFNDHATPERVHLWLDLMKNPTRTEPDE